MVTDRLSDYLFAPSADAVDNLVAEGYRTDQVHLVGNVMIDTLLRNVDGHGRARAMSGTASESPTDRTRSSRCIARRTSTTTTSSAGSSSALGSCRRSGSRSCSRPIPARPAGCAGSSCRSPTASASSSRSATSTSWHCRRPRRGAHRLGWRAGGDDRARRAVPDATREHRTADHRHRGHESRRGRRSRRTSSRPRSMCSTTASRIAARHSGTATPANASPTRSSTAAAPPAAVDRREDDRRVDWIDRARQPAQAPRRGADMRRRRCRRGVGGLPVGPPLGRTSRRDTAHLPQARQATGERATPPLSRDRVDRTTPVRSSGAFQQFAQAGISPVLRANSTMDPPLDPIRRALRHRSSDLTRRDALSLAARRLRHSLRHGPRRRQPPHTGRVRRRGHVTLVRRPPQVRRLAAPPRSSAPTDLRERGLRAGYRAVRRRLARPGSAPPLRDRERDRDRIARARLSTAWATSPAFGCCTSDDSCGARACETCCTRWD